MPTSALDVKKKILREKILTLVESGATIAQAAQICQISPGTASKLVKSAEAQEDLEEHFYSPLARAREQRHDRMEKWREKFALASEKSYERLMDILDDPMAERKDVIKVAQDFLDRDELTSRKSQMPASFSPQFTFNAEEMNFAKETAEEIGIPINVNKAND